MNGITPFRSVLLTLTFAFSFLVFLAWPAAESMHSGAFLLVAALVQAVLLSGPVLLLMALHARLQRSGHDFRLLAVVIHALALVTIVFLLANYKLQQMFGFYFNYFVLNGTGIRWAPGCFDSVVGNEGGYGAERARTVNDVHESLFVVFSFSSPC